MQCVLLLLAAMFTLSDGYCSEGSKIYVEPNQIAISEHGIFVNVDNAWFATEAIHADAAGIYTTELVDSNKYTEWICRYCRHVNSWLINACQKCGRRD